jgi:excisionase family DNA binding protein
MTPTELLTTEETATRLGVEPKTLDKWRSTKKYPLPFVKIGAKVRYSAAAVQKFIEDRTVTPGASSPGPVRSKRRYIRRKAG